MKVDDLSEKQHNPKTITTITTERTTCFQIYDEMQALPWDICR